MKKFVFMFAMAMMAIGCGTTRFDDIVLTVEVEDQTSKEVVLVYHTEIVTLELDEAGRAEFVIPDEDAVYARLYHYPNLNDCINLYMERGDRASVSFVGKDMKGTYVFEGEKAPAVEYLNTIMLTALPDEEYALSFADYNKKIEAKIADAVKILDASGTSKAGDFNEIEEGRIRYSFATQLIMHSLGHRFMTQNMSYEPDQDYYDVLDSYVVADDKWADLDQYREFIAEAAHILDEEGRDISDAYQRTLAQMRFLVDRFEAGKSRDVLLHRLAYAYVDRYGVQGIQDMENIYRTYVKDAALVSKYDAACAKWNLANVGSLSPDFKAVDLTGREYTLADFKGKYVYIDIWATWCGPCRQEIPHLKALEEHYRDAQIEFVSISVDQDKEKWSKMVSEQDMSGTQLYLGNESPFLEAYQVEEIPRFILLDKEGKILDKEMQRPSSEYTRQIIDTLEGIR